MADMNSDFRGASAAYTSMEAVMGKPMLFAFAMLIVYFVAQAFRDHQDIAHDEDAVNYTQLVAAILAVALLCWGVYKGASKDGPMSLWRKETAALLVAGYFLAQSLAAVLNDPDQGAVETSSLCMMIGASVVAFLVYTQVSGIGNMAKQKLDAAPSIQLTF